MKLFPFNKILKKNLNHAPIINNPILLDYPVSYKTYTNYDYILDYETISPLSDAIDEIVEHAANVSLDIYDSKSDVFSDNHPILSILKTPNLHESYFEMISKLMISYLVTGNAYLKVTTGIISKDIVMIENVIPTEVEINVKTSDQYQRGYRIQVGGYKSDEFDRVVENGRLLYKNKKNSYLFHMKRPGINRTRWRYYGFSKLNSIMNELSLYKVGMLYNRSMLKNQGRPSSIITTKDNTSLSQEQITHAAEQIKSHFSGSLNAGQTLFLPLDGLDFKQLSLNAKDMEYVQLHDIVTKSVYNRFNVPLSLIQSSSLSLANMEVALLHLFVNAVLPCLDVALSFINRNILSFYDVDPSIAISYDKRNMSALLPLQLDKLTKEKSLNVLSTNEIRSQMNRDPISGGDDVLAPSNFVPVGETGNSDGFIDSDGDGNNEDI